MGSPSTRKRGSKQFWPRVRAAKPQAVVNSWKSKVLPKETNFLGFPGYKAGMTNIGIIDNFSHTLTKGTQIDTAVTIIECPPINVLSLKLFSIDEYGNLQIVKEVSTPIKDKHLSRKIDVQKKSSKMPTAEELIKFAKENDIYEVRAKVATTPSNTTIGKKKPEILELGISGSVEDAINFGLSKVGSTVKIKEVFNGGELVDSHGVTKGYGHQGAVKRFGVKLTSHKSEKKRRHAGNVGAWTPSRVLTTIPMPGQHGFHERTEWNKWILSISDKPENNRVIITKSTDFYQPGQYEKISGAEVVVTELNGESYIFTENSKGEYTNINLVAKIGKEYSINVNYNNTSYSAKSVMKPQLEMDSIAVISEKRPFRDEPFYEYHVYFQDNPEMEDFARFKLYFDGVVKNGIFRYDDRLTDGNYIDFWQFFFEPDDDIKPGVEVTIELLTIDKASFEYLNTLRRVLASSTGGPFGSTSPSNPNTNWNNGALGYFSAFSIDSKSVIIE